MWKYNGEEITDIDQFPEGTFGFVYRVLNKKTSKAYIGKKVLYHSLKKKLTKKELAEIEGQGRRPSFRLVVKESDWKQYRSSNKQVQEWFKDKENDQLELRILRFCSNTKSLTYYELQEQFAHDVLGDKRALNDNLLGKFFRRDLE